MKTPATTTKMFKARCRPHKWISFLSTTHMMALAAPETIRYSPVMNAIAANADRGLAKKLPPASRIRIPKTR